MTALAANGARGPEPRTVAPFGRRLCEVVASEEVGAYRVISARDASGPADPRPGQFYMLAANSLRGAEPGPGERPYLPRALSFCRVRPQRTDSGAGAVLDFLLEAVGPGTGRLGTLLPGDGLWLTGPLGVGFSPPLRGRALLVAGGIGVAPILAWHEALGGSPPVLLGFRSSGYAEARRLFGAQPLVATDDGSVGSRAPVTELLGDQLDAEAEATVYACGPPAMLESVRSLCAERRVAAELALESGMACGYGACYGCVAPTRDGYVRLCLDGPVLDAAVLDTALFAGAGH